MAIGDEQILEDWFDYISDEAEKRRYGRKNKTEEEYDKFDWEFDHDDSY